MSLLQKSRKRFRSLRIFFAIWYLFAEMQKFITPILNIRLKGIVGKGINVNPSIQPVTYKLTKY